MKQNIFILACAVALSLLCSCHKEEESTDTRRYANVLEVRIFTADDGRKAVLKEITGSTHIEFFYDTPPRLSGFAVDGVHYQIQEGKVFGNGKEWTFRSDNVNHLITSFKGEDYEITEDHSRLYKKYTDSEGVAHEVRFSHGSYENGPIQYDILRREEGDGWVNY